MESNNTVLTSDEAKALRDEVLKNYYSKVRHLTFDRPILGAQVPIGHGFDHREKLGRAGPILGLDPWV